MSTGSECLRDRPMALGAVVAKIAGDGRAGSLSHRTRPFAVLAARPGRSDRGSLVKVGQPAWAKSRMMAVPMPYGLSGQ